MGTSLSPSTGCVSVAEATIALDEVVPRLLELDDEPARRRFVERCLLLFTVNELLPLLKAESERYLQIDAHIALRLAETLIYAAEAIGQPQHHALGLMAKGDALRILGHYQESLAFLEEAGRAFLAQHNEVGWARTRLGWLVSSHFLGRGAEALEAVGAAYGILVRHREWIRAAGLDVNSAAVCQWLGRYDQALQLYDRAHRTYETLGAAVEARAARTQANKAMILTLLGDFDAALALHEEARQVFIRHAEPVAVLRQDQYIADVYAGQGRYTQALRLCGDVFVALERAGQEVDAAWAALNMVECYLNLNRSREALELADETVARFARCGTPTEMAKAQFLCALAHARLGDGERALGLLDEAARAFAETGLIAQLGIVTLQRAHLHLDEANWSAALEEAHSAHALFAERGLVARRVQAEIAQARALLGLGCRQEAATLARAALTTVRERDLPWLAHEGHHLLARVAEADREAARALNEYRAAAASIERVQHRLAIELRGDFLADKLPVYHDAIDCCLRLSRPDLAFDYLERAKSRALVDYLTVHSDVHLRVRGALDQELVDELARLREEHNWFYDRLYGHGLTRRPTVGPDTSEVATLQAAIQDREKRIARVLERLALRRPEGLEGIAPPLADQPLVRPALTEGTILLEYYFRADGGAVFVLRNEQLEVVPLAVRSGEIQRLLHLWYLNLDAAARAVLAGKSLDQLGRNARGLLERLHRALLAPVVDHLTGCERLVIVPYGPTHAAPFHALYDGRRYLLESLEVAVCPSSSLLRLCTGRPRRAERRALVVAYSNGGQLPAALDEARAVAALLPGECFLEERATRAVLAESVPHHAILHLAAHGEARLDNPTFAHLKLADGQLNMVDVFNLELDGALVTLSACETGRSVVAGGDELIGLSRGFLHAGAATLVQSLWRVEDGSTANLMERFYRALRDGQPKGAALREAQLALLDERGSHPFYWAPFQLIGDSGVL